MPANWRNYEKGALEYYVPIYETYRNGETLIVEPTPESAFVMVTSEEYRGFRTYPDAESYAKERGLALKHAGYFYNGHYYTDKTPECESLIQVLDEHLDRLTQVETVEVTRMEKVVDWAFTMRASAYAAVGVQVAVWVSAFLMKYLL